MSVHPLLKRKPCHLRAYAKQYAKDQGIDLEHAVSDILTDVLHICREEGIDYGFRYGVASSNFLAEREDLIYAIPDDKLPIFTGDDTMEPCEKRALADRLKGE